MLHYFAGVVEHYGYIAVVLLVTIESLGIPLPGETAVIIAAAFAATGSLSAVGVAIAATLGTFLGGSGGYWIGRRHGRTVLERFGHLVRLDPQQISRAELYFTHHGMKTVFFARFVALLRILGSVLAGVAHMPFGLFTLVNLLGGALWAVTFTALGYAFGANLPRLHHNLTLATLVLMAVILVGVLVYLVKRRIAREVVRGEGGENGER